MFARISIIVFSLLLTSQISFAEIRSVKGNNVNLRSGPTTDSAVKWEYGNGFPLKILQHKGDWVEVSDFEQDRGWIHTSLLSDTPYVIVNVNKDSKKIINIRKGPSTNDEIVGKAFYGVVFELLEKRNDWVHVRHESGLEGWVSTALLWGV